MSKDVTHTVKVGDAVYVELMRRQLRAVEKGTSRPTVDDILIDALRISKKRRPVARSSARSAA